MKTQAIIQARYGATRLPGKVLLKVMNKTILEYVIERVKKARRLDDVIVATTVKKEDLEIVKLVSSLGISVYCGSEEDVLDRYYQAARAFKVSHIVRITADCPLIDPRVIDRVVYDYFNTKADYCATTEDTFPDGEDVEVFSFGTLKSAWQNANLLSEREHVSSYITKHPEKFKLKNVMCEHQGVSFKRWTLDREEDFQYIKIVLENLYPKNPSFSMEDILKFLEDNPHIEEINKNVIRNEGYIKSLKEDRRIIRDTNEIF